MPYTGQRKLTNTYGFDRISTAYVDTTNTEQEKKRKEGKSDRKNRTASRAALTTPKRTRAKAAASQRSVLNARAANATRKRTTQQWRRALNAKTRTPESSSDSPVFAARTQVDVERRRRVAFGFLRLPPDLSICEHAQHFV